MFYLLCLLCMLQGVSFAENTTTVDGEDTMATPVLTVATKRFEKSAVLITGASKGIGKGIAKAFAQEGANLVLVGRDETALKEVVAAITDKGGKAIYVVGDVSKAQDMQKVAQTCISTYGRIDVLCHNAGIYPHARLETMSLQEWDEVISVNLTGTFLALQACLPQMKAQKAGKVVVTSSISGPRTALSGFAHYTASKAGVNGFIKTAAVELAKYNITVNAVEPGNIMTDTLETLGDEHVASMTRAIPLGRLGLPEDIAGATLFLASKDASFITGQSIVVDGGQTLPESHFSEF